MPTATATDLYELLGVPADASAARIRSRYRELAQVAHPDHGGSDALFRLVQDAYATLSDPAARRAYDQRRARRTRDREHRPAPAPPAPAPSAAAAAPRGRRRPRPAPTAKPMDPTRRCLFGAAVAVAAALRVQIAVAVWAAFGWHQAVPVVPLGTTLCAGLGVIAALRAPQLIGWFGARKRRTVALAALFVAGEVLGLVSVLLVAALIALPFMLLGSLLRD